LIYAILILLVLLSLSIYYSVKFGLIILKIEDAIEESLDVIDEKYDSMSEILERPLFYDSPEVRQVLQDIKLTRHSLHKIAFTLSRDFEAPKDAKDEEDEEEEVQN
jgi:hypothetical protein